MEMMISQPQRNLSKPAKNVTMPVIYEQAVRDLVACQTLDEAKYFSDKAEALAAWAKIYKDDQAGVEAKRLKLHAYRRMGQLAEEIRPKRTIATGGAAPGPVSLLIEHGFSKNTAEQMRCLALKTDERFNELVQLPSPLTPNYILSHGDLSDKKWALLARSMSSLRAAVRMNPAAQLAVEIDPKNVASARAMAIELVEWLDDFERHLPK